MTVPGSVQRRLTLVEDRQRIARDLHERVIQDLLGLGMELLSSDEPLDEPSRIDAVVDRLDAAVRRLRAVVFDPRDPSFEAPVSAVLGSVVDEAARALDHVPVLSIDGGLDDLETTIADQLVPTLRAALSYVARCTGVTSTAVDVRVAHDVVVLDVTCDGTAPPAVAAGVPGFRNLSERAHLLGGDAEERAVPGGGTRVRWSVPRTVGADQSQGG